MPLPPLHPSLPRTPAVVYQNQQQAQAGPSTPYAAYPSYYGSHYAQAYYGQTAGMPQTAAAYYAPQPPTITQNKPKTMPLHLMSSWYQQGSSRCSHQKCTFTGSQKSVELHMMDRHLIYPPGWEKQKKKREWDADPSLKGKPIPIQGTNVILDKPEVLDAWIAERKNRFPISTRVEEKKRKMDEAIARGQLDLSVRPNKRQKFGGQQDSGRGRGTFNARRGRGGHQQRGRGGRSAVNGHQRQPDTALPQKPSDTLADGVPGAVNVNPSKKLHVDYLSDDGSSSDDDAPPEEISSKRPDQPTDAVATFSVTEDARPAPIPLEPAKKPRPPAQPRPPARKPFSARPALLRSLLLPDICMTVSNLSQAIRFIVDNDFLRDVELKPGQAAEHQKIRVLDSQETGS